jgi:uncharacterized protein involved in type VI secretion and phage assembly
MIQTLDFYSLIQDIATEAVMKRIPVSKVGYITSFDPRNYSVRVRLEPESTANEKSGRTNPVVETGWLPLNRPFGGNGWGMQAPPKATPNPPYGDMVLVCWADSPAAAGFAIGPFYTDQERAPHGKSSGELRLSHSSGAFVELLTDGTVRFQSSTGTKVELNGNNTAYVVTSDGAHIDFDAGGNITIEGGGGAKIKFNGANVEIN